MVRKVIAQKRECISGRLILTKDGAQTDGPSVSDKIEETCSSSISLLKERVNTFGRKMIPSRATTVSFIGPSIQINVNRHTKTRSREKADNRNQSTRDPYIRVIYYKF